MTTKYLFDLKPEDVYFCTADVGWITGHSYVTYGVLSNGGTTLLYEGTPNFPEPDRFWRMIDKHRVSNFYTAPTAIRSFIKWGDDWLTPHDLSSLRLLGSVGRANQSRGVGCGITTRSAASAARSSTRGGRPKRVAT